MLRTEIVKRLNSDVSTTEGCDVKLIVIQDTLWPGVREYRCSVSDGKTYSALTHEHEGLDVFDTDFTEVPERREK